MLAHSNHQPANGVEATRPRFIRPNLSRALIIFLAILVLAAAQQNVMRAQTLAESALILPEGRVGEDYLIQFAADGGPAATVWRVSSATPLPPGLLLSASGGLSGKPTTAQNTPYVFTVEVAGSADAPALFVQTYALRIQGPIRRVTISSPSSAASGMVKARLAAEDPCGEPLDVESNSDSVTIAVRNNYDYNDNDKNVINFDDKKKPIKNQNMLIDSTFGQCYKEWQHDDYVIVHLVKWPEADPQVRAGNPIKYEVEKEKWFLYRNTAANGPVPNWEPQTVQEGTRIYGQRRVAVLLVHLTARDTWDIKYTVDVKGKIPAPIQNVIDLAAIILGGNKTARFTDEPPPSPPSYWGGRMLLLKDIPADIAVQSNIAFLPSSQLSANFKPASNEVSQEQQTQQPKQYSKTYDNEGRYHWDVSVGLPVKSFKEVQFSAEDGQVTAKEITRQNAYGFLNLFLNPNGVDTKGEEFIKTPHLILGVPISGKPLDRPMVGLGMGFYKTAFKFNIFAGAVFNRVREPRTLGVGQTATTAQLESDLRTRRVTKFIFGFNIPVKQFKEALTKK